jgi:2-polyprenyl-6-methoxyphenol hydroxylase-like FAD-dependent oxidoreductase
VRVQMLSYHTGPGQILNVPLGANAPVLLPQVDTGRLLEEALQRLGVGVERSVRVTGVEPGVTSVVARATGPEGDVSIEADWLVGADGVQSAVRQSLGIDFTGAPFPVTFLLAEGHLAGDFDRQALHYFLAGKGAAVAAPLPGDRARISGAIHGDTVVTSDTVQTMLDERGPGGLRMSDVDTLDTFSCQERIAAAFRQDRCFLVGDAAHVHSPVGGQGLSLGFEDTRNLAWKLAGVIDGRLDPAILASYYPERRLAAEQVLEMTKRMARQAVIGPVAARVRNAAMRGLGAAGVLKRWYAPMLAGQLIRYPDVLAVATAGTGRARRSPSTRFLPRPGTAAPDWIPAPGPDRSAPFRLVTFGPAGDGLEAPARAEVGRVPGLATHDHVVRSRSGFAVIRPDGFVAASGVPAEVERAGRLLLGLAGPASQPDAEPASR